MTQMPKDAAGTPIPALSLRDGGAHQIAIGATSARNATAFNEKTIIASLYCTTPCYVAFGDETVEATVNDHYFPAGVYYDFAIGYNSLVTYKEENNQHYTHIAVLRVGTDGVAYVSEKI